MGFLDWVKGGIPDTSPASARRPQWMRDGMKATEVGGAEDLPVVGESFHQDSLWTVVGGRRGERVRQTVHAILVAEHGNQHDADAVSVWVAGHKVGHLSREDARRLRPGLLRLQQAHRQPIALPGVITGGGTERNLGVFLNFDAAEFGVPATRRQPPWTGKARTGLSNAIETDAADDRYDLGWVADLPGDPAHRVRRLQELLHTETEMISRHYVFAELESTLYGLRESLPTALADYDSTCRHHDAEMGYIVPALLEKFGEVPRLDTYRQAAIRHHKAKDTAMALWWAERGIAWYATHPANADALLDLHKRAGTYRTAIARTR